MELDWSVDREGGASLVGVRVRNDGAVPRRVRIESRLDGPLLPPRRGGVPEAGWDATGVTRVIDPGERAAFGFAALAEPTDPPVEIASVEPVSSGGGDAHETAEGEVGLARAAVRDLGSHRPPRATVDGEREIDPDAAENGGAGASGSDRDVADRAQDGTDGEAERGESAAGSPAKSAADDGVDAWFAAVESRIERAERLTDADLAAATAVVEERGGLDGVGELDERVAADAERLRAVRDRAAALAERAEESEVPAEALEALS
ncbi:hypothetical protein C464_15390 [Halorubrum coriense DSM 10284]|uniref:DUF8080 domain-containing protein n=1 Tax=Halorubrum coriense DSM 10284 TaxID=1227466 RepID=M0ECS9_9EURY|nr:hypothetical protein [Halorubrum coriense]ELZ44229.1 hypothetical protein C464_15390 [Halorubrum coriense DSM 10284]